MFISTLTGGTSTQALEATLRFNHHRLKTLAENIANFGTPGYRTKQLDARAFQKALRTAMDERRGGAALQVNAGREVSTDAAGRMKIHPSQAPVENILFHDGTNASMESQMSQLAQTGLTQRLATDLLKDKFDGLRKAIRGQA